MANPLQGNNNNPSLDPDVEAAMNPAVILERTTEHLERTSDTMQIATQTISSMRDAITQAEGVILSLENRVRTLTESASMWKTLFVVCCILLVGAVVAIIVLACFV